MEGFRPRLPFLLCLISISACAVLRHTCSVPSLIWIVMEPVAGVRAKNEMGWWLIRASNTEEAIVVRFEGKSQKDQDGLLIEVKERLKNEGLTWEYS